MKNLFYFIMFSFFIFTTGCKKDVEQPALTFPFEVKANPEKIEAGIETLDNVPLTFIINKSYNNTVTMKYNITSLKKFSATDEKGQNIELNKWYNLKRDTLILNYKALEQGEHDIKVLFSNSKEYQVEKKVNLTFANNNEYTIEDVFITNLNTVYQGQEIEYNFKIKPLEGSTENYEIQFLSFDDLDLHGESTIFLNNEKVNLEEWVKIQPENLHKVRLKSHNVGLKKFVFQIKNSEKTKKIEKELNIKRAQISLERLSLSTNEILLKEPFKIIGTVIKTNPQNKKIQYKTWVTKGDANAVNDTETYRNLQLTEDNLFSEEITITNVGDYTINVQARDEFGNESEVKTFNVKVASQMEILEANVYFSEPHYRETNNGGIRHEQGRFSYQIKAKAGTGNRLVKVRIVLQGEEITRNIDYKVEEAISSNELTTKCYSNDDVTIIIQDNYGNTQEKRIKMTRNIPSGYNIRRICK